MTGFVEFPKLGIALELNRVAFSLGSIDIYWYGLLAASGFVAGCVYAFTFAPKVGVDEDRLIDVIMAAMVGGIIGARAYYVIFSWDMYKDNLMSIFNIRHGGIAIYGGIIGGIIAGGLMARARRVKILPVLDLAAGSLLIGQSVGRWGNFVNIEAFGSNTDSIFGMTGPQITGYLQQVKQTGAAWAQNIDPYMPVHPTFLYESIWCFIGFIIIAFFIMKRRRFDGEAFLFYVLWYGVGRAIIEGLRTDSLMMGNVRVSQLLALVCAVVATGIWLRIRDRKKKLGDEYRPLFINSEDGEKVVKGVYYQKAKTPEIIVQDDLAATISQEEDGASSEKTDDNQNTDS